MVQSINPKKIVDNVNAARSLIRTIWLIISSIISIIIIICGLSVGDDLIPEIDGIPHILVRIGLIMFLILFFQGPWLIMALIKKYIDDLKKKDI